MVLFSMTTKGFRTKKHLSGWSVQVFSGFSYKMLQTPDCLLHYVYHLFVFSLRKIIPLHWECCCEGHFLVFP